MTRALLVLCACALSQWPALLCSQEEPDPQLRQFYNDLRMVVLRHYREASTHQLDGKFHAEHDTRIYLIHLPRLTGDVQDASEVRGPKRGGVLCDVLVQNGNYGGMAAVPQTFERHYFKSLMLAPYSAQRDQHITVHLSYPADVKPEFLKEFTAAVNRFSDLTK